MRTFYATGVNSAPMASVGSDVREDAARRACEPARRAAEMIKLMSGAQDEHAPDPWEAPPGHARRAQDRESVQPALRPRRSYSCRTTGRDGGVRYAPENGECARIRGRGGTNRAHGVRSHPGGTHKTHPRPRRRGPPTMSAPFRPRIVRAPRRCRWHFVWPAVLFAGPRPPPTRFSPKWPVGAPVRRREASPGKLSRASSRCT